MDNPNTPATNFIATMITTTPETDERMGLPSGSGFHIVVNCAGSQNMVKSLLKEDLIQFSKQDGVRDRGNLIHEARKMSDESLLTEVDDIAAYRNGVFHETMRVAEWLESLPVSEQAKRVVSLIRERRLWLTDGLKPVLSAQLDSYYRVEESGKVYAFVLDWKTGFAGHTGSAAENWQLRVSAVLMRNEYDAVQTRVGLIKPDRGKEGTSDVADYTEDVLGRWEYAIHYHLWLADQPDAPRRAGDWCFFCPARGACPESGVMALAPSYVSPEQIVADDKEKAIDWVKRMPIEDAAAIHRKRRLITQIFDGIYARLQGLTNRELAELGLGRTSGKKTDAITDNQQARLILKTKLALSDAELDGVMKFNKEELKKLVAEMEGISIKDADKWINRNLDRAMTRGRGKPSLVDLT